MEVRKRVVYDLFNHVDHQFAVRVAEGIGIPAPETQARGNHGKRSPALSQENTVKNTVRSRKVAILVANGCGRPRCRRRRTHDERVARDI